MKLLVDEFQNVSYRQFRALLEGVEDGDVFVVLVDDKGATGEAPLSFSQRAAMIREFLQTSEDECEIVALAQKRGVTLEQEVYALRNALSASEVWGIEGGPLESFLNVSLFPAAPLDGAQSQQERTRLAIFEAFDRMWSTPQVCVDMLLTYRRQILAVRKRGDPSWHLPGGYMSGRDRSPQACAERELLEETSLEAGSALELVGLYPIEEWRGHLETVLLAVYKSTVVHREQPSSSDDVVDAQWILGEEFLEGMHEQYEPIRRAIESSLADH